MTTVSRGRGGSRPTSTGATLGTPRPTRHSNMRLRACAAREGRSGGGRQPGPVDRRRALYGPMPVPEAIERCERILQDASGGRLWPAPIRSLAAPCVRCKGGSTKPASWRRRPARWRTSASWLRGGPRVRRRSRVHRAPGGRRRRRRARAQDGVRRRRQTRRARGSCRRRLRSWRTRYWTGVDSTTPRPTSCSGRKRRRRGGPHHESAGAKRARG